MSNFYDPETASPAQANTADFLERMFAQFQYGGPLVDFGKVFILIDTNLGECCVSCYPVKGVVQRVSMTLPQGGTRSMGVAEAIQFLRDNGAKSDWVAR